MSKSGDEGIYTLVQKALVKSFYRLSLFLKISNKKLKNRQNIFYSRQNGFNGSSLPQDPFSSMNDTRDHLPSIDGRMVMGF